MEIPLLVDDYLRHIDLERNLSHHTVDQYTRDLRRWIRYLEENDVTLDTDRVDVHHIRSFVRDLSSSGLSPRTVARKLACLKSFCTFACRFHQVEQNPASGVGYPKFPQRLPDVLTHSEVARLLDACSDNYFRVYRVRDKAMLAVLACLGLRRQELMGLTLDDWDAEERTVRIREAKNGRERLLPTTNELVGLVNEWLAVRPETEQPYLFVSRQGMGISANALQRLLERLSDAAGIERRVHPHMFRHYAATTMVSNNGPGGVEHARRILGHLSHGTLAVYTHLSVDDLRRVVSDTAALSGIPQRADLDGGGPVTDPHVGLAAERLVELVKGLGTSWQRDQRVVDWLRVEWTRQAVPEQGAAFGFQATHRVLVSRQTMQHLDLDAHVAIAGFGRLAGSELQARRPHAVEAVLDIGARLGRGLMDRPVTGEGVTEAQLRSLNRQLCEPRRHADPLVVLAGVVSVALAVREIRGDVPNGRCAIEMLTGLLAWDRGLPPLITPAAERQLWRLLLDRYVAGDRGPALAYAVAKVAGLAGELSSLLSVPTLPAQELPEH